MKLSVVIPAYNEELRILAALRSAAGYLGARHDYEIIVVDDGSIDRTARVCEDFFKKNKRGRVIKNKKNSGKGASVRRGILAAEGDLILFSDADMSTPVEEIEKLMGALDEGADIAIGSRSLKQSDVRVHQPFLREKMGKCFNLIVRTAVLGGIMDTQCGFKLFKRGCAQDIFRMSRLDKFAFDVEALFIGRMLGYKIKEVPVVWVNSPASRVNVLTDPLRMLADVLRIRVFQIAGGYKP